MKHRFYITTAIDYPNSVPHLGHAYEKVVADFYARCAQLRGWDTRFLIGLDEHGQKIQEAAAQAGKTPQEFVDEKAVAFRDLYSLLEITNDDFIRTSAERHRRFATEIYELLRQNGDIYKGVYQADYCISCERSLTKTELVDGKCPTHQRPTTPVEEESYFFRLGKYRDAVRDYIERHPDFIVPEERRNEVLSRLADEVLDLSISRSTFDWGIPLPNDPDHVLYVWIDALSNYISALWEPREVYDRYWPADCHVIGKDILWFHTVIWPAMLLSAGMPLPRQVYAHGFILDKDGLKMAKHLGNIIDPLDVVREYSVDVLRFYCLRAFSSTEDGRFSIAELEERYQSELANELGNLVMRLSKLARQRCGGTVAPPGQAPDLDARPVVKEYLGCVDRREHNRALDCLWSFIRRTNAYLSEKAPWKLDDGREVHRIVYSGLEALRNILHLLHPVMPRASAKAAESLGFEITTLADLVSGSFTYRAREAAPLFPRRDKPATGAGKGKGKPPAAVDPFAKLEIRIGRIAEVHEHPNADTLFAMTVDLGEEKRSICAGLRGHVTAEELQDRKVVVLANLKPALLRGVESRGMILAADRKDGTVVPVNPGDAALGELARVEGIEPRPKSKLSMSDFEKAPLTVQAGRVTYGGKPLLTSGDASLSCDAEDGTRVR